MISNSFWLSKIAIFLKVYRPDNFQSQNSLTLSFTSIQCPGWNFVRYEYVFESNSSDIAALCETKLDE